MLLTRLTQNKSDRLPAAHCRRAWHGFLLGALLAAQGVVMAASVNPFSIGVSIGQGIGLRLLLWVVLTAMAVGWVLRYAVRAQRDPSSSLLADAPPEDGAAAAGQAEAPAAQDGPRARVMGWR